MKLIQEIKENLRMEVRPNSKGTEYLEAVIDKNDIESLLMILTKHFGPAAKEPGKNAKFSTEIQEFVDGLGGVRIEQSFFYKRDGSKVVYAVLWPWQSNPNKITLKSGTEKLVS
jgi:hypothetical protein